uniref:Uncharacterized protein n=1 Tax=Rhizophora mucronata TaxID=61149 RepID=A0A2P2KFM8_RHIMU
MYLKAISNFPHIDLHPIGRRSNINNFCIQSMRPTKQNNIAEELLDMLDQKMWRGTLEI